MLLMFIFNSMSSKGNGFILLIMFLISIILVIIMIKKSKSKFTRAITSFASILTIFAFFGYSINSGTPAFNNIFSDELTNEPTNELTNELTNEPTNESTDEPTNDLTNEPTNESTNEPTNKSNKNNSDIINTKEVKSNLLVVEPKKLDLRVENTTNQYLNDLESNYIPTGNTFEDILRKKPSIEPSVKITYSIVDNSKNIIDIVVKAQNSNEVIINIYDLTNIVLSGGIFENTSRTSNQFNELTIYTTCIFNKTGSYNIKATIKSLSSEYSFLDKSIFCEEKLSVY